ncbi:ABC transporter permease, partial [Streptomyces xinghaiensis]
MTNTHEAAPGSTVAVSAPRRGRHPFFVQLERFALVLAWLAIIAIFGTLAPDSFLSWANFSSIFGSQAVLVILTLGLIVPLTAGDIDLSVAQVLTLSSMIIAVLNVSLGWPIAAAIAVAIL